MVVLQWMLLYLLPDGSRVTKTYGKVMYFYLPDFTTCSRTCLHPHSHHIIITEDYISKMYFVYILGHPYITVKVSRCLVWDIVMYNFVA